MSAWVRSFNLCTPKNMHPFPSKPRLRMALGAIAAAAVLAACGGGNTDSQVYSASNGTANSIVHMGAKADGSLTVLNAVATGGAGTNTGPDPLTSQGSLIVTPDHQTLFAVNGGDNSISAFSIDHHSGDLTLLKNNATTGILPVSLAFDSGHLYVLFQGRPAVNVYPVKNGVLGPLLGSYAISNAVGKPTQITLSPDRQYLLVNAGTASNAVDAFPVKADGTLGTAVLNTGIASPFASEFLDGHNLLVSNTSAHALQSLAFSKGVLSANGAPVVGDVQGAPCWLVITPDGRYAYTGSGGSGTVSAYKVSDKGTLTLLNARAAAENLGVAGDSWISPDGKYLYTAYLAAGKVISYAVGQDGALTPVGAPAIVTPGNTMQGLAGNS